MLDIDRIKSDFPILDVAVADNRPLVYLDNAATTQKPQAVIDAIRSCYLTDNAVNNLKGHSLAQKTGTRIEHARKMVADFINAKDPQEITFCRGTTEAINIVANTWGTTKLLPGDEVLVSGMEHHSNLVPWQMACLRQNAHLKAIPINTKGELDLGKLKDMINSKTRMLALVHTSNTLGTINPVEEIISIAHQKGVPVLLDGAQTVAHQVVDVQQLDCDFFAFSAHKIYGPTGIGALYSKTSQIEGLLPIFGGCGSHTDVTPTQSTLVQGRSKLDTGIANLSAVVGLETGIDYLSDLGMREVADHLHDLLEYATERLRSVDGLKIIGEASDKTGIISFTLDPIHPHDLGTFLDQDGIAVRTGHHCTLPIMQFFEIPGTVRVSFGVYNRREEIDHLVESLVGIRKYFNG